VDTRSIIATIGHTLHSLDEDMLSFNCKIKCFNLHVHVQHNALMSWGDTYSNLLKNLYTVYEAVEDKAFHDYMVGQQDQHHNSRIDFDKDSLMDLALNKFKMWSSPKGGTALLG